MAAFHSPAPIVQLRIWRRMMKALNDEVSPSDLARLPVCGVNCEQLDMCEVFNSFCKWVTFNEDVWGYWKTKYEAGGTFLEAK